MAAIYTTHDGSTITEGLEGCNTSDQAITVARRIAAERGESVLLNDDDGEWIVRPDGRADRLAPEGRLRDIQLNLENDE